MIRLSKFTDYSIIILTFLGKNPATIWQTSVIAEKTHLTKPTVAKILKRLVKVNFVVSHQGKTGGYKISVDPAELSLAKIITALEGRVTISECNAKASCCTMLKTCPLTSPLAKINRLIYETLDTYKLRDLITINIEVEAEQKMDLNLGAMHDYR